MISCDTFMVSYVSSFTLMDIRTHEKVRIKMGVYILMDGLGD